MRQIAHQNFGGKIYRPDGVCTFAHPQGWERRESPRLGASLKPELTVLPANTLDIRRNCRQIHMLDDTARHSVLCCGLLHFRYHWSGARNPMSWSCRPHSDTRFAGQFVIFRSTRVDIRHPRGVVIAVSNHQFRVSRRPVRRACRSAYNSCRAGCWTLVAATPSHVTSR